MSATSQYPAIIQPRSSHTAPPPVKRFRPNPPSDTPPHPSVPQQQQQPIFSASASSSLPQQPVNQTLYIETTTNNNGGYSASPSPHVLEIKTEPQPYSPTQQQQQQQQSFFNNRNSSPIQPPLTPTAAVQQYTQMAETERKKKGPSMRPAEELCLVCGDRASGYHYNALACEGCKGFFRRSITKNSNYSCKWNGDCEIDMYMRRKCQACRLKKCYTTGMRAECVVPERTCIQKREAKQRAQKQQQMGNADSTDSLSSKHTNSNRVSTSSTSVMSLGTELPPFAKRLSTIKPLKPEEEELINRLVYFQEEYEHPTEADLNRVYHVPLHSTSSSNSSPSSSGSSSLSNGTNSNESESDRLFRHMTEMTILTVQLIVEFSKHLPGFQNLCRDDQINLLKGCSSEVMMLRGARRYDAQSDSIVYATNYPFTKENYVKAGLGNDELFRFCRAMSRMKVDNAEYALITAIVIFSDRNYLREPKRVEKIQEIYVDALQAYVMANRKKSQMVTFAKLLFVLTELRSLGINNSELCFSLKLKNRKLPPFLMEIWDIE